MSINYKNYKNIVAPLHAQESADQYY